MIDGNFRVLKLALGIGMSDAQFVHLARAARGGILMALAAGLRVVERAEAIGEGLNFFERGLIGAVSGGVDHTIALVVKARGSLGKRRCKREKTERQEYRNAGE